MVISKQIRITLMLIVLILLNYCTTQSQSYNVTHYNEQSGLNNSAVWSVAQDLDGKMWFATKKGFSIYDGINWNTDNYTYQAVGPDNLKLSTDEKGYIWSITRNIDIFLYLVLMAHNASVYFKALTFLEVLLLLL
jgi:ligand-binding sensor domain-containing protein